MAHACITCGMNLLLQHAAIQGVGSRPMHAAQGYRLYCRMEASGSREGGSQLHSCMHACTAARRQCSCAWDSIAADYVRGEADTYLCVARVAASASLLLSCSLRR